MDTNIFVEAAEKVDLDKEEFSCCAIIRAGEYNNKNKDRQKARENYCELYEIRGHETFENVHKRLLGSYVSYEELKEIRVLALLFAAQVFKNKRKL